MTERRRFDGRTVLITGSTGMAASAARAIAAEGGAMFVVSRTAAHLESLVDEIRAADAVRAAGGRGAWYAADLRDEGQVEAAFEACTAALGTPDAVYSVAGISGRRFGDGPLHEATLEGWQAVLGANATSQFLVARAAVRRILAQEPGADGQRGAILLMSSTLATHPAPTFFATHGYAASKGAIEALTRSAAAYYAPHGIRINAVAPSLIATPMSRRAQDDPGIVAYLARKQPLAGGPIDADAVTATALHLLSDDARMITGQVIAVDGGWTVTESADAG
jgi:NAD(P)-dependent dehydrogenase (short-subunit alcohol dehydrogenase family)